MRRFISISWISLFVIVAGVGVLGLVPAERDRVNSAIHNGSFDVHLKQQAAQRPKDPEAWLAAAAASRSWYPPRLPDLSAFQHVSRLRPGWAAPYLVLGYAVVSLVPLNRPQELAAIQRTAPYPREALPPGKREEAVRTARTALLRARHLDPDNAAPDYLLAYLALAERRDNDAVGLLRSAMLKQHWSIGTREIYIARYRAYARKMPELEAAMFAWEFTFVPGAALRNLARVAKGMAVLAEQRGDAERAIFLRESVMHLGQLVAADGYTLIDAFTGHAIWGMGASQRLTPEESAAATKGLSKPRPGEEGTPRLQRWIKALREAGHAKGASYLRTHGRPDLAASIAAFDGEREAWLRRARRVNDQYSRRLDDLMRLATAGATLALLIVCGLPYLALTAFGRRPAPVPWARWKWMLVVLACIGVATALAMYRRPWFAWWPESGWDTEIPFAAAFATVGLGLLALSALAVTAVMRRRLGAPVRVGFFRQYVGTITAVLLPLTAVLMVGCLAMSVPLMVRAEAGAQRYKAIIYRGELAYYGLQRPLAAHEHVK